MGLLDAILGRSRPVRPDLDRLFALPATAITLQAGAGLTPTGQGSICFASVEGGAFRRLQQEVRELLDADTPRGGVPVEFRQDDYGYSWLCVRHPAEDTVSLVNDLHAVNTLLEVDVQEIRLSDVSYTYPGMSVPALHGINVTLRAGETVAFVGVNGSGKSTCSKLIAGLYDAASGTVSWNGRDARELDGVSLQQRVAMVLQDPVHYPFTALANITVSRGSLTESDPRAARDAAVAAGADQVISALPGTWEALLSKRFQGGQELSAGQWAKIAVARGLYKNAPVLLLDEPTASMDPRAEHAVYQSVLQGPRRPGQITVLISHRLASVVDCDRIYVFDDGKITAAGTHRELMDQEGEYAQMFTLQAAGYQSAAAAPEEAG